MIALDFFAIVLAQERDLGVCLDAFGDDLQAQAWPSEMTALATALSFPSWGISSMNDLVDLHRPTGKRFRAARLE